MVVGDPGGGGVVVIIVGATDVTMNELEIWTDLLAPGRQSQRSLASGAESSLYTALGSSISSLDLSIYFPLSFFHTSLQFSKLAADRRDCRAETGSPTKI